MRNIRWRIVYLLAGIFFLLSSCDSYQKVLKSTDLDYKYERAQEYYNKKDYFKALPIFEELISIYRGSRNIEKIYFYFSYCHYGQGSLLLAAYHFQNLVKTYPTSEYADESQFMYAYCQYLLSPPTSLDQTYTHKAIEAFQLFNNIFPNSERVEQSNSYIEQLLAKLEEKSFKSSMLYFKLGHFQAAVTSFRNLLINHPTYDDKDDVYFYILNASFSLAENSISSKKIERFNATIQAYYDLIDNYPSSEHIKQAEEMYTTSVKQLNILKNE